MSVPALSQYSDSVKVALCSSMPTAAVNSRPSKQCHRTNELDVRNAGFLDALRRSGNM